MDPALTYSNHYETAVRHCGSTRSRAVDRKTVTAARMCGTHTVGCEFVQTFDSGVPVSLTRRYQPVSLDFAAAGRGVRPRHAVTDLTGLVLS